MTNNSCFCFILSYQQQLLVCILLFLLCSSSNTAVTTSSSERHRLASLREQAHADAWLKQAMEDRTATTTTTSHEQQQQWDDCPCDDKALCVTIQGPPLLPTGEFFGFANTETTDVSYFNWTFLSTVAWASSEIMCEAHKHGARAVISTPSIHNLTTLQDATARQTWVQNVVFMVQSRFMDGVTFDYEQPMLAADSSDAATYVQLVQETTEQLHALNPSLQVTVCVAWSPDGIDGRNYPAKALAQAADGLYIMDYDTQSQVMFGPCIAAANAPYYGMIYGVTRYLSLGIAPSKLILGVPFYGYRYPCQLFLSDAKNRFCPIPPVPFRGVPCSDAAGTEMPVLKILQRLYQSGAHLQRDDNQDAPYFNVIEHNNSSSSNNNTNRNNLTVIQYWFDDPTSLRHKYAWAQSQNLAGVGPYALIDMNPKLDPTWGPKHAVAYWSAFDAFYGEDNATAEKT